MAEIELEAGQTIVFEGDSLTALRAGPMLDQWPWLRISNNHRSWGDVVAELLFAWRPDLGLTFRTGAVGGSSCRELAARFEETVGQVRPAWVWMTLGHNDAARGVPVAEFEGTLREYARKVGAWGGRVVFVYGFVPCPNAGEGAAEGAEKRRPYYAVQEMLARQLPNVQVLDVGTPLKEKAEAHYRKYAGHSVYSDGTHFSHLGAIIIAGEVLRACGVAR